MGLCMYLKCCLEGKAVAFLDSKATAFCESGVIPLSHGCCSSEALVGGKGKQLAQLYQLQGTFSVPDGLCVTTEAFMEFIKVTD